MDSCVLYRHVVLFMQAEQELSEMSYQLDEMSTRLEEADGMTSAQVCSLYVESTHCSVELHRHIVVVVKFLFINCIQI